MPPDAEDQKNPVARGRRTLGPRPDSPENVIAAYRKARRAQRRAQPPAAAEAVPVGAAGGSATTDTSSRTPRRADTDPWTVPQSVRDRFVQEGNRFYFPDGEVAFSDRGRRLTTTSENTEVVRSLVEIARSRRWTEVSVSGTDAFRREAWSQARLAGLAVRGYRPTEIERSELVRALARGSLAPTGSTSAEPEPALSALPEARREAPPPPKEERYVGRLLDHGKDTYRHDPDAQPSYFVRLGIPGGYREVWGKDIERAVAKSLTQPQPGDEVILQRVGRDAVTVKRAEKDAEGQVQHREIDTYRNRWVLEKREFFERRTAAAQVVRDETIGARDAVRQHPELVGTYLTLRAAALAAKRLGDPGDQKRFVAQVRRALAEEIERGEQLLRVRLRERIVDKQATTPSRRIDAPEITR